ncbi:MAG TPA: hypothetical protein VK463_10770, partial [Desulfomonilaceae bacterium]|nr:hypothetical protein [Desulfomonilaceae bacterium]
AHSDHAIMSLRGVERRSNLSLGQLEIASDFARAMTIFQSVRRIKTGLISEKLCTSAVTGFHYFEFP